MSIIFAYCLEAVTNFFSHPDIWSYLNIPVISALIGWSTNWFGIQMMFYPVKPWGKPPFFGWQGIIPARAGYFAGLQIKQIEGLVNFDELVNRLDTKQLYEELHPIMQKMARELIDESMRETSPLLWESLPVIVKNRIYAKVDRDLPDFLDKLVEDGKARSSELFDVNALVVNTLNEDKSILVNLLLKTVGEELKVLIKSGFYLGFLLGIVQMLVWYNFQSNWLTLPIGGLCIGLFTNWIAIKLILKPVHPIKIGRLRIQGLFFKRQFEVANDYSEHLVQNVLTPQNINEYILKGPSSDKLFKILEHHLKDEVDHFSGVGKPLFQLAFGTQSYIDLKQKVSEKVIREFKESPENLSDAYEVTEKMLGLEEELKGSMQRLSPPELDRFVRPMFEQDEWIVYAVGAGLGFLSGWLQFIVIFGNEVLKVV